MISSEWEKDVGRETSSYLLPGLQKLRQICNYCLDSFVSEENEIPCEENFEDEEFNYDETINRKRRFVACFPQSQDHNPRLESKIQRILSGSSKLQVELTTFSISYELASRLTHSNSE